MVPRNKGKDGGDGGDTEERWGEIDSLLKE